MIMISVVTVAELEREEEAARRQLGRRMARLEALEHALGLQAQEEVQELSTDHLTSR